MGCPQKVIENARIWGNPPRGRQLPLPPPPLKMGRPKGWEHGNGGGGNGGFGVGVTDGHQRLVALLHHIPVQRLLPRVQQHIGLHGRQGIPYRAGRPLKGGARGGGTAERQRSPQPHISQPITPKPSPVSNSRPHPDPIFPPHRGEGGRGGGMTPKPNAVRYNPPPPPPPSIGTWN